jgi:hypothetical protein
MSNSIVFWVVTACNLVVETGSSCETIMVSSHRITFLNVTSVSTSYLTRNIVFQIFVAVSVLSISVRHFWDILMHFVWMYKYACHQHYPQPSQLIIFINHFLWNSFLTHCGPVKQICVFCVFASQLWKTDDENLPFNTRLVFTHLITQHIKRT